MTSLSRHPFVQLVRILVLALGAVFVTGAPGLASPTPLGQWPLRPQPQVVRGFDPPEDPWGSGHRGVDLLGRADQPVRAALAGTVSFSGVIAGRGVVVVDHGDTRTTYEPLAARVPRGTSVAAGDVIGRLSTFGSHCLPRTCLHWGWLRGETYLDPLLLVGQGPIRLLPLAGLPAASPVGPGPADRHGPLAAYPDWRPLIAASTTPQLPRLLHPGFLP